jgi:hypothetical protein
MKASCCQPLPYTVLKGTYGLQDIAVFKGYGIAPGKTIFVSQSVQTNSQSFHLLRMVDVCCLWTLATDSVVSYSSNKI